MSSSYAKPEHSAFTQWCRGLIQMLSYEDILSITVYLPPMLFMAGPAAIVLNSSWVSLLMNAIVGFACSLVLHRVGHRLLRVLQKEPKVVYLSASMRLPVNLTMTQFVWAMEIIVASAVFSAVVGKRFFLFGSVLEAQTSAIFFVVALGLYFFPVYLARLWIKRYYATLPLLRPTEEVATKSLPVVRFY
jgi:hypothetical protein